MTSRKIGRFQIVVAILTKIRSFGEENISEFFLKL